MSTRISQGNLTKYEVVMLKLQLHARRLLSFIVDLFQGVCSEMERTGK